MNKKVERKHTHSASHKIKQAPATSAVSKGARLGEKSFTEVKSHELGGPKQASALKGKKPGVFIEKRTKGKSGKKKAIGVGIIVNPAQANILAYRHGKKTIVKILAVPKRERGGWFRALYDQLPSVSVSARKLSQWSIRDLTGTASKTFKETVQKAKNYVFTNKEYFKKLAFTTVTSCWFEIAIVQTLRVVTEAFISITAVRIISYVVAEILWCALSNRAIPVEELKKMVKGIPYPVLSTVVEFVLRPFFFNIPLSALIKPLYGKGFKDITYINVSEYLEYLVEKGLLIGKEKTILVGTKFIFNKAVRTSFEEIVKRPLRNFT